MWMGNYLYRLFLSVELEERKGMRAALKCHAIKK